MTSVKGYRCIGGTANIRAAKGDYRFIPSHPIVGGHGVIAMHQAGVSFLVQFNQSLNPISSQILPALARKGIPAIAGEINGSVGGDGFGNVSTIADMEAARVFMDTKNPLIDGSKVHLLGVSMGLHACLSYAQQNPSKVASITGIVGLADAMHSYDDVPAQQVAMRTAWAAADRTALNASGFNNAAGMAGIYTAGIPVQMFYSTADTVILPITQTTVGATLHAALYPISASLNHTDAEQIMGLIRDSGAGNWDALSGFMLSHQ